MGCKDEREQVFACVTRHFNNIFMSRTLKIPRPIMNFISIAKKRKTCFETGAPAPSAVFNTFPRETTSERIITLYAVA